MGTLAEQETTITWSSADDEIRVWTSRPKELGEMRRRVAAGQAREVATGPDWADFRIPVGGWSMRGFKRVDNRTDEQRQAAADRFRAMHAARKEAS